MITEVLPVAFVPNSIVQRVLLSRLRLQTGGTILVSTILRSKDRFLSAENSWTVFQWINKLLHNPFFSVECGMEFL